MKQPEKTGHLHVDAFGRARRAKQEENRLDDRNDYMANDWELSQELTPDPFAEEEHSLTHAYRHQAGK